MGRPPAVAARRDDGPWPRAMAARRHRASGRRVGTRGALSSRASAVAPPPAPLSMPDPSSPPRPSSICVFCGSQPGADPAYLEVAREFGALLARRGIGLVYGGARVGLMGALADAALEDGGRVTGVIPQGLWEREVGHTGLSELLVVDSMHERKALMAERAEAFVALPGGAGTLEELFEVWTWGQLGIHAKPVALLNVGGYWDPLLAMLDHMVEQRFLRAPHRAMVVVDERPDRLLAKLEAYEAPVVPRWMKSVEEG